MRKPETETLAKLAVAFSGLVWGLFWMPLRALDHIGIGALWSLTIFYLVPALIVLPLLALRWRQARDGGLGLVAIGIAVAAPLILYSLAILNTGVIRAMMLFYLTPVWSTLLERIVLKQPITPARWFAIAFAFAGMLVIFRADHGWPVRENMGDWAALAAGFGWSVATVMLRLDRRHAALDMFIQNFLWSGLLIVAVVAVMGWRDAPPISLVASQMWWLMPVIVLVIMTGAYASLWGAPQLSPGIVGILYMTEISAGTVTAAIWSGDPFGWREAVGIALITAAGLLETAVNAIRRPGVAAP